MPNLFGTLPTRARQRAVLHDQARSQAMKNLNDIYKRVERYDNTHIHPQSYASLDIKCGTFLLDRDGKSLDAKENCSLPFFEPRGASWIPNLNITDARMRETFQVFNDNWDAVLTSGLMRERPKTQAYSVCSWLEHMFSYFTRESSHPNVASLSKWRHSGKLIPEIFAERFYLAAFPYNRYSTYAVYASKKQLSSTKTTAPHTLITIAIGEEPSEDLFKAEAMIIAAAMISRLEGDECKAYSVIPITLVTAMGGMQARVIQAHSSGQSLVLSKTKVFDFATNQMATANIDILLGLMGSDQVGDPADPDHILKVEVQQVVTQQGSDHKRFQSIRKFFRPARETSAASWESRKCSTPRPQIPQPWRL
ncbi:uncharacterized protein N7498_004010 [Penicillium cinerascens]|uniref:Uncharacterized protein n=1 Tax=Penicillium cinerascens TaxID=70096 RepID=A0A9W9N413_9EURO|nr:uncharacterized protein N7498_004010 [Penicillium cinerascens]KAJ5212364.1 hypothetical protein N7498_004010 [Penicillium cinerascens]